MRPVLTLTEGSTVDMPCATVWPAVSFECITKNVIIDFLDWIQENRHCSNATRNCRLAALRSFFCYMQYENPERMYEWQKILSIKVKRHGKQSINYLTTDGIKLILEQPDQSTGSGRRNLAMLALMYDISILLFPQLPRFLLIYFNTIY